MAQVKHRFPSTQFPAATNRRNLRTLLLVSQLHAEEIGARIAKARHELGLSQEQVADVATFSKRSLQDYETGVTIPYKQMAEIGKILKRDVAWLLHGDPEPSVQSQNGLLGEVAENVSELSDSMAEALLRLARIEASLGTGAERDTGT